MTSHAMGWAAVVGMVNGASKVSSSKRRVEVINLSRFRLFCGGSVSSIFADFEALLALIFIGGLIVVGIGMAIVSAMFALIGFSIFDVGMIPRILLSLVLLLAAALEFRSWRFLYSGLNHAAHPRPVSLALHGAARVALSRAACMVWWLGHWAIIIGVAEWLIHIQAVPANDYLVQVALLLMAAYAANCFLLLAAAQVWPGPVLQRIWKCRPVIDVTIALAGAFLL